MTGFTLWFLGALVLGTVAFAEDVDCRAPSHGIEAGQLGTPADYARDVECAQKLLARRSSRCSEAPASTRATSSTGKPRRFGAQ